MNRCEGGDLEISGRPKLKENEIEILVQSEMEIEVKGAGDVKDVGVVGGIGLPFVVGSVLWRLTTHRILLCGQVKTESSAFQIQLGCVVGLTVKPHSWFQKSIHFTIHLNSENKATDVEVACLGGQRDLVVSKLRETLNAKHWETVPIYTLTRQKKADFDTKKAGIAGLIKEQEEKNKEIESTVSQAFTDLKALMSNAADMVALAKRLNTSTFTDKDELHQYRNILMDMGMSPSMSASNTSESKVVDIELVSSPVTKDLAGDLFHSELSRQIVDFVEKNALLKKNIGGKQILTDLYCIYNRARGTDLVSPNDFFEACLLFKKLGLPLRVSKLESGDYVVQHNTNNDDAVMEHIRSMILQSLFPLTAVQFATKLGISVPLGKYYLLKAEEEGDLCRDDAFEGLIFYHNIFSSR